MTDLLRPIRGAVRRWRQAPVLALSIVVLIGLGVSGVATLFGPLYSLILAPLPLPDSDRLVRLGGGIPTFNVYTSSLNDAQRYHSLFSNIAVYAPVPSGSGPWTIASSTRPMFVASLATTPQFFETIGVSPQVGRTLINESTNATSVVISDHLWRTQFGQSASVVGSSVAIGARPYTIVGIMPKGFDFPRGVDAWLPIGSTPYDPAQLETVARLRAALSGATAAAALAGPSGKPARAIPGQFGRNGPNIQLLQTYLRGDVRSLLWTLWCASAAFLLLACVGVANILLAHGLRRRHEVSVQLALGATRSQLVRQFLIETLVLVVIGAAIGLWISAAAGGWLLSQFGDLPSGQAFMPATVTLVAIVIVAVTVACGLAPALHATRVAYAKAGRMSVSHRLRVSFMPARESLAVLQLSLALGLLIAAGLLMRSLSTQLNQPLGFTPEGVVTFRTEIPPSPERVDRESAFQRLQNLPVGERTRQTTALRTATAPQVRLEYLRNSLFVSNLVERLRALPSVKAVGALGPTPFTSEAATLVHGFPFRVSRLLRPYGNDMGEDVYAVGGIVSPGGFDVLGIPFVRGRPFTQEDVANTLSARLARATAADVPQSAEPAIVNSALARRVWGSDDALGEYFSGGSRSRSFVVVGVVGNFRWTQRAADDLPAVYLPSVVDSVSNFVVKLKAGAAADSFSAEADALVRSELPNAPRLAVRRLDDLVIAGQRDLRIASELLGWFAILGTVVASIGVHTSTTLFAVSRRREMAVRLALGATPASIRILLLAQVCRVLIAFPFGWALGWGIARPLAHLLLNVDSTDPASYLVSSAVCLFSVVVATAMPVARAGAVDPAHVLRNE